MKDIVLVISLLLAVGLSVVVVRFAEKADKAGKSLEEERYSRMVAEETLQKNDAKMATLQDSVVTLQGSLKEDQNKMAKIVDILNQEKTINLDLKKQYDALTTAKTNLENKLQTVLQEKAAAAAALQSQAQVPTPAGGAAQPALQAAQPAAQSATVGH